MGERYAFPLPTSLPSLPLFSLCRESAPWKPARGSESFPSGVRIRILVYFELENRTWRQRVLQTLSRKTAVSARSAGTTFKNFTNKISGGISPPPAICLEETLVTGPRKKFDNIFSRPDTIHERDIGTDKRTPGDSKDRAYAWRRVVKSHLY